MRQIIKAILTLTILVFMTVLFLSSTNAGLNLSLVFLKKILPGELKVSRAKGRLIDHFELHELSYKDPDLSLSSTYLDIQWQAWKLFTGKIAIQSLTTKSLELKIIQQTQTKESDEPISWSPPLSLSLEQLSIGQLTLDIDNKKYQLEDISASLLINRQQLLMKKLQVTTLGHRGSLRGYQQMVKPYKSEFQGEIQALTPSTNKVATSRSQVEGSRPVAGSGYGPHKIIDTQFSVQGESLKYTLKSHWRAPMKANIQGAANLLNFPKKISWQISADVHQLELAAFLPQIDTSLNFNFTQSGHYQDGVLQQESQLNDLEGQYNHQTINGKLRLDTQGRQLRALNAELRLANNRLKISDHNNQQSHVEWQLNIDKLSQILPSARGTLNSEGKLRIQPKHVEISGRLLGQDLAMFGLQLPKIHASFNYGEKLALTLEANTPRFKDQVFQLISMSIQGNPLNAQIKSQFILDDEKSLLILAHLKRLKKAWRLDIEQIKAALSKSDIWVLSAPSYLLWQASSIVLAPLCLIQKENKLCGEADWNTPSNTLKAKLNVQLKNLNFLDKIVDDLNNTQGQVTGQLAVSGQLNDLNYQGAFELTNGSVESKSLELAFKAVTLSLKTQQKHWTLKASAETSESQGTIHLSGSGQLQADNLDASLHLSGQSLTISNQQQYQIKLNPDITLTARNNHLQIKGVIKIPYARIRGYDSSDSVTLPRDVVFVDRDPTPPSAIKYDANIKIELGDDIRLNVMGLGGKINGALMIYDSDDEATTATGSLAIKKGEFKAYGQNLKINHGRLVYAGGPIDNPAIDIKASREITVSGSGNMFNNLVSDPQSNSGMNNKVVVGINVRGYLHEPEIKLFSSPANLSQADTLSYLILGRSSSQATDADGQLLAGALSSLNLGRGEKKQLLGQINQTLGIKVGLGTQSNYDSKSQSYSDQTAFIISKALSPKLFISYSIGLIEGTSLFKIKYLINKYWSIQTESGDDINGVDLYYTYVSHA